MTDQEIIHAHRQIDPADSLTRIDAARYIVSTTDTEAEVEDESSATAILIAAFHSFLNRGNYLKAALLAWGTELFDPRPHSVKMIWGGISSNSKTLAMGAGSLGKSYTPAAFVILDFVVDPYFTTWKIISTTAGHAKCLGYGTEVRMFDGSIKEVQDITIGDIVMGPDSSARRVTGTTSGVDEMFRVNHSRGASFICNGDHKLSLRQTYDQPSRWKYKGEIRDVAVRDYLGKSDTFKGEFKAFRVGWELPEKPLEFDPYILGMWAGDGSSYGPAITNKDPILIGHWCNYFTSRGYRIVSYQKQGCGTYYARRAVLGTYGRGMFGNPFITFTQRHCRENEQKIVPECVRNNSKLVRAQWLAGLIDTDGTVADRCFAITTKFPELADGVEKLAISLGFYVHREPGKYQRLSLRGSCHLLPTKLKIIEAGATDPQASNLTIVSVGRGNYYGFSLDGDNRFVLASGIVTHNSNMFSTLVDFHRNSVVPLPGEIQDGFIGMDRNSRRSSIAQVSIKEGQDGSASLQGFHPLPRPQAHPLFGKMSRVGAVIDEAEDVAEVGLWQGLDNMLLNEDFQGSVRIYGATNPKNRASQFARRAEPPKGWGDVDVERDEAWVSREGYNVIRLDGAKCENVIHKRVIYPGLVTYEGYMNLLRKGTNSPAYATFARGMYPDQTASYYVMQPRITEGVIGEYTFEAKGLRELGSLDPAFEEGGDNAIFTKARYGKAIGWTPLGGRYDKFEVARWALQIQQQFPIVKGDSLDMAEDVADLCQQFRIRPEDFVMDRSGNATGFFHALNRLMPGLLGLKWGSSPTELRIFQEDVALAAEEYDNLVTEMWFTFARWMEHGFILFTPVLDTSAMFSQATSRKYKQVKGVLVRIESKKDFKFNSGGNSPDEMDSAVMLPQLIRERFFIRNAAIEPEPATRESDDDYMGDSGEAGDFMGDRPGIDKIDFVTF